MKFQTGARGTYRVEVADAHTAHTQGNPDVRVLSTPTLTLYCEIAAYEAIRRDYEPGWTSVGLHNDLWHLAATPAGETVTIEAVLTEIDRKRLSFAITGRDRYQDIVRGTHERVYVRLDRFLERVRAKRQ